MLSGLYVYEEPQSTLKNWEAVILFPVALFLWFIGIAQHFVSKVGGSKRHEINHL